MSSHRWSLVAASVVLLATGCMSASTRRTIAEAEPRPARRPAGAAERETSPPPDEAALARPVDRATLEAAALARHPGLVEAAHRARALIAKARAEGSLPPPEIEAVLQQVPLERPYAIDDAGMLMVQLRQEIPPAGSLDDSAAAMALEARAAGLMATSQARDIVREVDRAFADYVEASARHASHVGHLALMERTQALARARLAAGGSLSDVTRADLEKARLDADVARESAAIDASRAMLNGLMARPVDAPLGPPRTADPETVALTAQAIADRAVAKSPVVAASDAMKQAAERAKDAADDEATLPTFMVGLSYFHPVGEMPVGWGASVGMSLPWVWGAASDRSESASERALAERSAADAARVRVRSDVGKAFAAVKGAERRLTVLDAGARGAAERALDALTAGYAAGGTDILMWLDAERSSLDVELDVTMARADLDRALADLDWAAGERLPRVPLRAAAKTEDAR